LSGGIFCLSKGVFLEKIKSFSKNFQKTTKKRLTNQQEILRKSLTARA